jgi:hypothetical protein
MDGSTTKDVRELKESGSPRTNRENCATMSGAKSTKDRALKTEKALAGGWKTPVKMT